MPVPFVVPFYAGIFAVMYFFLTIRVARMRGAAGIAFGSGGNPGLERAIRAHGNFIEYVPLALILLGFVEMHRHSIYELHALCLLLLLGRILHAIAMSQEPEVRGLRFIGMLLTGLVLICAAASLIYDYFRIAATI